MRRLTAALICLVTVAIVATGLFAFRARHAEAANPLSSRWLRGELVLYPPDHPGDIYCVDATNGADTNTGLDWDNALATIDAAVNKCSANQGDMIYVAPWHSENLAADSAIDIDVAGVTVVGIKQGRQMPELTATATAGDCKLAAANVTVKNLRFIGGIDATTGIVEVSAADCAIIDCEYRDDTGQATDAIITTAAADRLTIRGHRHIGAAGDGGNTAIALVGANDALIEGCLLYGNFDLGAIQCRTTKSERIRVDDCAIWTEGSEDLAIKDSVTSSTGIIGPDVHIVLQDDAANVTEAVTGATFYVIEGVSVVNAANEKSMSINWTATTD